MLGRRGCGGTSLRLGISWGMLVGRDGGSWGELGRRLVGSLVGISGLPAPSKGFLMDPARPAANPSEENGPPMVGGRAPAPGGGNPTGPGGPYGL